MSSSATLDIDVELMITIFSLLVGDIFSSDTEFVSMLNIIGFLLFAYWSPSFELAWLKLSICESPWLLLIFFQWSEGVKIIKLESVESFLDSTISIDDVLATSISSAGLYLPDDTIVLPSSKFYILS